MYNNYSGYTLGPAQYSGPYRNGYVQRQGPRRYSAYRNSRPHSGCRVHKDVVSKSGAKKALIVQGWKYTKGTGLFSFVAVPASSKYQKDKNHVTCVASVSSRLGNSTVWCHWNPGKQILSIPSMRLVASAAWGVKYLAPKGYNRNNYRR